MTSSPAATPARVVQVNVSPGGVPKLPVAEAWVDRYGLAGDRHNDATEHGGPHRAVALFALEAIRRVQADGHPITPGSAGENLTTVGVELATLPVGTRLAIGERLVLEISKADNPCKTIAANFSDGRFARISIAVHPRDSRMYARVLVEGPVRPGDAIHVLPPSPDSRARLHELLDRIEAVEQHQALILWRGARLAGHDVRILDDGDLSAAAAPGLDHPAFNRAYGLRQLPQLGSRLADLYTAAATPGYLVAAEEPWPAAPVAASFRLHSGRSAAVIAAAPPPGVTIRTLPAAEVASWLDVVRPGWPEGPVADAFTAGWGAVGASFGTGLLVAAMAGRAVGAGLVFVRRGLGLLGAAYVRPEARGRGIHRALIAARAAHAAAEGAAEVAAEAGIDSIASRNLAAVGLEAVWTRHDFRFDPADPAGGSPATATLSAGRLA